MRESLTQTSGHLWAPRRTEWEHSTPLGKSSPHRKVRFDGCTHTLHASHTVSATSPCNDSATAARHFSPSHVGRQTRLCPPTMKGRGARGGGYMFGSCTRRRSAQKTPVVSIPERRRRGLRGTPPTSAAACPPDPPAAAPTPVVLFPAGLFRPEEPSGEFCLWKAGGSSAVSGEGSCGSSSCEEPREEREGGESVKWLSKTVGRRRLETRESWPKRRATSRRRASLSSCG